MNLDDLNMEAEFRSRSVKHKLPYSFVSQLGRTEINQGVAVPDVMEWLDIILPSFTGRVKQSTEE